MRRTFLPDSITIAGGRVLKPVIGGHLDGKPFLTLAGAGVDVTKSGWLSMASSDPEGFEARQIIREAKRRMLKYRTVYVLGRNLRGKTDLYGRPYKANRWFLVEVER